MIHYTCDRCKREINTAFETRHVVMIEIQSVIEGIPDDFEDDVDHLSELNQMLEEIGDDESCDAADVSSRRRYDLCPECHRHFCKNPLGRENILALGFSNN